MKRETFYIIEAAVTQQQVEDGQCDCSDKCYSVKEAKDRAKYLLSDTYANMAELHNPMGYARILKNGELDNGACVADFFRK